MERERDEGERLRKGGQRGGLNECNVEDEKERRRETEHLSKHFSCSPHLGYRLERRSDRRRRGRSEKDGRRERWNKGERD